MDATGISGRPNRARPLRARRSSIDDVLDCAFGGVRRCAVPLGATEVAPPVDIAWAT